MSHQILAATASDQFLLSFHLAVLISSASKQSSSVWLLFLSRLIICAGVLPCTILIYQKNPQLLSTDISLSFQSRRIFLTFITCWVALVLIDSFGGTFFSSKQKRFFFLLYRGKGRGNCISPTCTFSALCVLQQSKTARTGHNSL